MTDGHTRTGTLADVAALLGSGRGKAALARALIASPFISAFAVVLAGGTFGQAAGRVAIVAGTGAMTALGFLAAIVLLFGNEAR